MTEYVAIPALALTLVALWWERRRATQALAARLGLRFEPGGLRDVLVGERDGVGVRVVLGQEARIEAGGAPTGVRVVGRGVAQRYGMGEVARGMTGDPGFDQIVQVDGDPERVSAALDAETRRNLRHLVGGFGATVFDGRVEVSSRREDLRERLDVVVQVAGALAAGAIAERLRANARDDPSPGVRRRCLRLLADAGDLDAARAARADPDMLVRLQAKVLLGEPLGDVTVALLATIAPEDPERVFAAVAGDAELLRALASHPSPAVRSAARSRVGDAGGRLTTSAEEGGTVAIAAEAGAVCAVPGTGDRKVAT
ncbi:MAG: hypothetical protein ACOZNI_06050 [Myxococcota bacterium]